MRRRATTGLGLLGSVAFAGGLALLSYPLWRPWCLHWGATDEEVRRPLPGDDLLEEPDVVTTRAIGIAAPTAAIWPWLVQMGPGRAGAYTYDWIENLVGLDMHSADELHPEYQDVAVGDAWQLGDGGPVLRVAVLDPESAMVLRSDDGNWVWAFVLAPRGTGTRLLSRNRIRLEGFSCPARAAFRSFMEPGSLVMERKMLLGIKARAERHRAGAPGRSGAGADEAGAAQEAATMRHQASRSSGSTAPST